MTISNPQTQKEERYWGFLKNNPYYLYIAHNKSHKPETVMVLFMDSPRSAMETIPDDCRDISVGIGKFTPKQSHHILRLAKIHVYGRDWRPHIWDLPTHQYSSWDNIYDTALSYATDYAIDNWKKSRM